ncbi:hypothetical protein KP509_14G080700 [Ceratopteris richardii]|nr:hypothetical protein KP509_14G080700 [Ceratopteris richardii]
MEKESDNLPSSGTDARGSRRPSPASVPKPYYYRCLPNRAADAAEKTKMQKQSQKTELMRDHPLQRNVQSEKDHDRIEDIAQQSITEGDSNSYGWFVRPDTPDLRESHMVKGGAGWYVRPPSSDLTGSRRMRRRMQDIPIEKLQAVKPVNGHENVLVTYTQIQACENLDQNQNSGALASVSDLRSRHKKFEGPVEPAFYRLNHPSRRLLGGFLRPASACSAREYERGGLFMLGGRRRLCRVEPLWHASCRKIRSRAPSSGCSRPVSECTERECRRRHQTNVHQRRLLNSSADKSYKENASDHSYQLQVPASKLKPSPYRYKDMSTILSSEPRKQRSALAKKTENTRQAMRDSLSTPADLRRARNPKKAQNDQKSEDDHGNLKHIQYRMPEKTYTDNVSTVDHSDIASLSGRSDSTAALNGFYEREPLRPPSANENIKTKRHDMDYEEGRTPCSSRAGSTGGRPRYKPGSKGTTPDYDSCYSQDEDDKRDELQSMAESELEESSRTPSRSRASNPDSKIKDKRGCLSEASTPRTTDERSSSTRREQHTSKRADKEKKSNGVPPNDSRGAVCPFQDTSHGAVTCSSSVISLPAIKPRQNEAQNQQLKLSVEVFPSPSAPKGFGLKITQHFPKEHQHAQVEYVNGLGLSPRSFQTSVCRRCSS